MQEKKYMKRAYTNIRSNISYMRMDDGNCFGYRVDILSVNNHILICFLSNRLLSMTSFQNKQIYVFNCQKLLRNRRTTIG